MSIHHKLMGLSDLPAVYCNVFLEIWEYILIFMRPLIRIITASLKFFDVSHLFCMRMVSGNIVWNCNLFTKMPKRFDNDLKIILYDDEIKMLKVWIEIELLCNKKKIENTYRLGTTRLIVFGVLIEPFPRFCRTFYITYINACTKFPSPMLMSPFFWHNQILAAFQTVYITNPQDHMCSAF